MNVAEQSSLSAESLFPCPGIASRFNGVPLESNRGAHNLSGVPYFVCGEKLYRINRTILAEIENFSIEELGEILGNKRVLIDDNGHQLSIVVPGEHLYIFDSSDDSITEIIDINYDGPVDSVAFVDGFFFYNKTDSGKILQSGLNDGLTFDALEFGSAEADPDKIVRLFKFNNELYALGTETITPFRNIGGAGFVMQPVQGGIIDIGLRSKYAIAKTKNSFVFLGSGENIEPAVYIFSGGQPQKISTEPIDSTIQNKTDFEIDNSFFLRYSNNGEDFILLTLGSKTFGFCYYASQLSGRKIWFERSSRISGKDYAWRVYSIIQAYNRLWVGDSIDGRIGLMSDKEGLEYDEPIIREFTTQPFHGSGRGVTVSEIELLMDGAGGDNYIELSWSDDGRNFSYGNAKAIGKEGQYNLRKIWRRLGRFPNIRSFRFTTSSSIPPVINKLLGRWK